MPISFYPVPEVPPSIDIDDVVLADNPFPVNSSDKFVRSVGYGKYFASYIKKCSYSYVSNTGSLRKFGGYLINYINMFFRYVYPIHWLGKSPHPGVRIKYLEQFVEQAEKVYSALKIKGK